MIFVGLICAAFCIWYAKLSLIHIFFGLSLLRALTSFSLVIAYQNIASGVASIIHFMYPLAVAVTTVSYTHLDVYKRQQWHRLLFHW